MVIQFKEKYGHPSYDRIKFRPRSPFTVDFGLDDTFGQLRIHPAVDRGTYINNRPRMLDWYLPFDCNRITWQETRSGFGSILRMFVKDADFEVRLMHTRREELSEEANKTIDNESSLEAGTYMGEVGNLGISVGSSDGRHSHTEIVSTGRTSLICDGILNDFPLPEIIYDTIVKSWAKDKELDSDEQVKIFNLEWERRKIEILFTTFCRRTDYLTGEIRTFYSSRILFNGM